MKICLFVTYHANQIYQMMSDNYKMIQVLSICFFFVYGANSQENQFNTKFKQHSENSPANKQFKTDHYNDENVTWSETALNLNAFIEPKYAQADDFDATNPVLIFNDDDANQPPILIDNSPPLLFDYDQLFNNGDSSNFQLNERDFSSFWPKIYLTPSRNENLKQSLNENDLDNDEVASNCEDYPENNVKKMAPLYSESDFDEMPLPYDPFEYLNKYKRKSKLKEPKLNGERTYSENSQLEKHEEPNDDDDQENNDHIEMATKIIPIHFRYY